jgi:hypothetical protein
VTLLTYYDAHEETKYRKIYCGGLEVSQVSPAEKKRGEGLRDMDNAEVMKAGTLPRFTCSVCKVEIRPGQQAVSFYRGWVDLSAVPSTGAEDYSIWLDKLQRPQVKGHLSCGRCSRWG